MIWFLTALILILVSAGLTYMIVSLIHEDEDLTLRDYVEPYVIILMLMAFIVYIGG